MSQLLTFDDVLIAPKFSTIQSRKDVTLNAHMGEKLLSLPVISANMDTVTDSDMCYAMGKAGGVGCLHRFMPPKATLSVWHENLDNKPIISIGLGSEEMGRACLLANAGATHFCIDVAHGAQLAVVEQANNLRKAVPHAYIIVGNFASADSVKEFLDRAFYSVDAFKVGVGPGSACTTRIKTGVGVPQLSAVMSIAKTLKNTDIQVIADGGMKTPGDIAKALGAGAHFVMLGGMLAGTDETPGEVIYPEVGPNEKACPVKKYRGSASHESYAVQGKVGSHRTAEGESFMVPYKGPVANILADIEGGVRSAMTYVGARNLDEFRERCEFVQISPATVRENGAHGKS